MEGFLMIKISNLFLLALLTIYLNQIQGMHTKRQHIESDLKSFIYTFEKELPISIKKEDYNKFKNLIETIKKFNINLNVATINEKPLFNYLFSYFLTSPSDFKLKAIEYLIQNGIKLNNTYFISKVDQLNPLEKIIDHLKGAERLPSFTKEELNFYYKLIALLLSYGQNITGPALALAIKSEHSNELLRMLNHHEDILNQATTNPTDELLLEAIASNQPYIVQLIANNKPELIISKIIEFAEEKSPFSAKILKRALAIQKFIQSELVQESLPPEVIERIEKFVNF